MPLTNKGEEILNAMQEQYGEKKGEEAFYASKNAGAISGVDAVLNWTAGTDQWMPGGSGDPVSPANGVSGVDSILKYGK